MLRPPPLHVDVHEVRMSGGGLAEVEALDRQQLSPHAAVRGNRALGGNHPPLLRDGIATALSGTRCPFVRADCVDARYDHLGALGEGSYGAVSRCRD
eukprot:gene54277-56912_t